MPLVDREFGLFQSSRLLKLEPDGWKKALVLADSIWLRLFRFNWPDLALFSSLGLPKKQNLHPN